MTATGKSYLLIGCDGRPYPSSTPGTFGGHRRNKIYGRLDCPVALRTVSAAKRLRHRVFFEDEQTAIAAGYRPCAACLPDEYARWKVDR